MLKQQRQRREVGTQARRAIGRLHTWRLQRDSWLHLQPEAEHRKARSGWRLVGRTLQAMRAH